MTHTKQKRKKSVLSLICLTVCLVALVGVFCFIWKEIQKETSIIHMEEENQEYIIETPDTPVENSNTTNEGDGYVFDWEQLQTINPDIVGWIRFDNPSRINYPIVQGDNNQTYLNHDWQGRYQPAGSIFMHKENQPNFTDANTILYGHRMIGGSMFGSLNNYASQDFLDANPYFYIYTPDGKKRTYEIYTYSQVTDGSDVYSIRFESSKERLEYFQFMKDRALTSRNVTLDQFDTSITLSTCASYGYYDRMVIQGKLISITQNQK